MGLHPYALPVDARVGFAGIGPLSTPQPFVASRADALVRPFHTDACGSVEARGVLTVVHFALARFPYVVSTTSTLKVRFTNSRTNPSIGTGTADTGIDDAVLAYCPFKAGRTLAREGVSFQTVDASSTVLAWIGNAIVCSVFTL